MVSARVVVVPLPIQVETSTLRKVLKRLHYPLDVMLVCVRWYAAYPLSLRNLEEMMAERGVIVDHATVQVIFRGAAVRPLDIAMLLARQLCLQGDHFGTFLRESRCAGPGNRRHIC